MIGLKNEAAISSGKASPDEIQLCIGLSLLAAESSEGQQHTQIPPPWTFEGLWSVECGVGTCGHCPPSCVCHSAIGQYAATSSPCSSHAEDPFLLQMICLAMADSTPSALLYSESANANAALLLVCCSAMLAACRPPFTLRRYACASAAS